MSFLFPSYRFDSWKYPDKISLVKLLRDNEFLWVAFLPVHFKLIWALCHVCQKIFIFSVITMKQKLSFESAQSIEKR